MLALRGRGAAGPARPVAEVEPADGPGDAASGGPGPGTRSGRRSPWSGAADRQSTCARDPEPLQAVEEGPGRPAVVVVRPAGRPGGGSSRRARPSRRLLAARAIGRRTPRTRSVARPVAPQASEHAEPSGQDRPRSRIARAPDIRRRGPARRWNRRAASLILVGRRRPGSPRSATAFRRTSHEFAPDGRDRPRPPRTS